MSQKSLIYLIITWWSHKLIFWWLPHLWSVKRATDLTFIWCCYSAPGGRAAIMLRVWPTSLGQSAANTQLWLCSAARWHLKFWYLWPKREKALLSSIQLSDCWKQIHDRSLLLSMSQWISRRWPAGAKTVPNIFTYRSWKVHSKPISSAEESISCDGERRVLSHIYHHHDNFIEACDVILQIWVG